MTAPIMVANLPALSDLHSSSNGLPSSNADASLPNSSIVNLDRGDTVLLESYWRKMSDDCTVVIKGREFLSYASDDLRSVCWFLMPKLRDAIQRLHALVGNAETNDKHIVVGNGSTQLFQSALFALSSSSSSSSSDNPMNVVAAAPYYSVSFSFCYPKSSFSSRNYGLLKELPGRFLFPIIGKFMPCLSRP